MQARAASGRIELVKPTVYIETTIPSYYCDERPALAADIARTREWWDHERGEYDCFISPVVLDELSAGEYPSRAACLTLVEALPLLAVVPEVIDLAEVYQARHVMPRAPVRDALHVALATHYRMDYLLTWNCRHIANANKARHLEVVNQRMGLSTPRLVTPHLLQPDEESP
jgi:predicted nucleic acid-binding protein